MRSNGAVHIGNDTFLAATEDVTDSIFLFSSSFPADQQRAALPLVRRVHFNPHSALPCSLAEAARYAAAERDDREEAESKTSRKDPFGYADTSSGSGGDNTSLPFRHTFFASPEGHQVAVVSNTLQRHYILDISDEPAEVCEVVMPHAVRSVCWHPVLPAVLYVLFTTGDVMVYDTSRSRIGVVLPCHRRLALRPVVEKCLAEEAALKFRTATPLSTAETKSGKASLTPPPPTSTSTTTAAAAAASASASTVTNSKKKGDASAKKAKGKGDAAATPLAQPYTSPSTYAGNKKADEADLNRESHAPTATATTTGAVHMPAATPPSDFEDGVMHIDKEPEEGEAEAQTSASAAAAAAAAAASSSAPPSARAVQSRTAPTDLVDLHLLAPTPSLPTMLLVLSSSGDVYAAQLNDDALPVAATSDSVDDGRLRSVVEQQRRLEKMAQESAPPIEMHHLIAGNVGDEGDEALAVRGCLIDADAGTHAVFFCTANGAVKGAWVSEADLLARHRVMHVAAAGEPDVSFTVHLDGRPSAARPLLSPAVPTTTHTVTMTMANDNLCLLRRGRMGEEAYLLAMPCWDKEQKGWCCWQPPLSTAAARAAARRSLPLLSTEVAVPPPVSLRLPYDTRGASVAVGAEEVLLMPEVSCVSEARHCDRQHILSVRLFSLLRAALYSRCGTLQLHPPSNEVKPPVPATASAAGGRAAVLTMVNCVPVCHRKWLCAAPQADVDGAVAHLAALVERQVTDTEHRERAQAQRRERLVARLSALEGRVKDMSGTFDRWQQTLLDAVVHRRGGAAVRTANERLGEVHTMLNEWEHQH